MNKVFILSFLLLAACQNMTVSREEAAANAAARKAEGECELEGLALPSMNYTPTVADRAARDAYLQKYVAACMKTRGY